jgi:hypothetical protein
MTFCTPHSVSINMPVIVSYHKFIRCVRLIMLKLKDKKLKPYTYWILVKVFISYPALPQCFGSFSREQRWSVWREAVFDQIWLCVSVVPPWTISFIHSFFQHFIRTFKMSETARVSRYNVVKNKKILPYGSYILVRHRNLNNYRHKLNLDKYLEKKCAMNMCV